MNRVGFIGLGTMGLPMAVNIARAGLELMVYNRTPGKDGPVLAAGGRRADSPAVLIEWAETVVLMLGGPEAVDAVLGPVLESPELLDGKIVVSMGTNPPAYTRKLAARLEQAGADFVDAPVSGTRVPAEQGALVIMAGGPAEAIEALAPVFNAVGNKIIPCGAAHQAGMMKLAVNIVLSAAISGLAEGAAFARKAELNLNTFFGIILGGPLGNDIFAVKADKMLKRDFTPQASIATVREMLKHIADSAYEMDAYIPNTLSNANLIAAAVNQGLAGEDACAIIKVFSAE
jgi:3-hydroxyisobutyrate dehydrogenase